MKITTLLLLTLFHFSVLAQNNGSSEKDINQTLIDLKKQINFKSLSIKDIDKISEIREIYNLLDLDSALRYASIQVKLVKKTENPNDLAHARLLKATLLWKLQRTNESHDLLLKNLADKDVISDTTLARSLFRIAKVEIQKKMPKESLEHVVEASEIYESLVDSASSAACFSHIAGIYTFVLQEPKKAVPYFDKAPNEQDTSCR